MRTFLRKLPWRTLLGTALLLVLVTAGALIVTCFKAANVRMTRLNFAFVRATTL